MYYVHWQYWFLEPLSKVRGKTLCVCGGGVRYTLEKQSTITSSEYNVLMSTFLLPFKPFTSLVFALFPLVLVGRPRSKFCVLAGPKTVDYPNRYHDGASPCVPDRRRNHEDRRRQVHEFRNQRENAVLGRVFRRRLSVCVFVFVFVPHYRLICGMKTFFFSMCRALKFISSNLFFCC